VGFFTPTEAGGVGACGAIVLSLIRKRLNRKTFRQAMMDTLRDTGMLFTIMIGAFVLNSFLAASTMPMELAGWIENLKLSPVLIMGVIVVAYLILGCFIDSLAMILLTIPVFYPLILNLGFDPIWFGIIVVICNEMAMITPPVGINVYVISGVAKGVPMHTVFKGIFPFFYAMLFMTVLLIAFPQIALFLVQYM
jgi:C4-dicarboxylate transporter DctM subunit